MASLTDSITPRRAVSELWLWHVRAGAAALLVGGAFGAGVLLGGDGPEEGEQVTAAADGASALALADSRSDKLDEVRAALKLRFHDELVGPPRDARDPRKAPVDEPSKGAAAAPEERSEPEDPALKAAREKALADQASPPERLDEDESVKAEDADEDVESIAAPSDDRARDQRRIAEALARVLGDDAPKWTTEAKETRQEEPADAEAPKAAPQQAKPAEAASGRFHVQVAATPSEEGANALVEKLGEQGFSALVVPVDLEGRGRVFRVRVGPYGDRPAAEAAIAEVRDSAGLNGFVVSE